ncbi:MAG TPA: DNA polymerase III subunit delta [Gemmatimonadaceae bacterium]|nr:DNA polymerase III subunit delta [Gemmatimonadaceae bacterium]
MSPAPDRAFWKSIQTRSFERVYYLYGEDDFLKGQAVRALIESAVDPATRDFNLDIRSAAELDAETLGSLVGTPPMMADRRVVVIRDVAALKKAPRAMLDRYLDQEPRHVRDGAADTDIVLVLVSAGGDKAKPDRALASHALAVEFAPLTEDRVPRWIVHYVDTELHASITPAAASLLQRAIGPDLPLLASELDKLASFANGSEIDEAAVSAVVGVRRGETLGDLLDAVAHRDAARALDLLTHVLEQPKTTGVSIVMALTTQMLALAWGGAMHQERGLSGHRLESEYYPFLKGAGGAVTGRPWGEAVKAWVQSVDQWDAHSLDLALTHLLAADIALKETRVSSDHQLLSNLLLALCAPAAAPAAPRAPRSRRSLVA